MSSCCKASQSDVDLEYFDLLNKVTYLINSRSLEAKQKDIKSNVKCSVYTDLLKALRKFEKDTGYEL